MSEVLEGQPGGGLPVKSYRMIHDGKRVLTVAGAEGRMTLSPRHQMVEGTLDALIAKAEELGLENPPKPVPVVRPMSDEEKAAAVPALESFVAAGHENLRPALAEAQQCAAAIAARKMAPEERE